MPERYLHKLQFTELSLKTYVIEKKKNYLSLQDTEIVCLFVGGERRMRLGYLTLWHAS